MRPLTLAGLAITALAAAVAPSVNAQTLSVTPATVQATTPAGGATTPGSIDLVFTNVSPGGTAGFQADLTFNNAVVTATPSAPTVANHFNTCVIVPPNIVRVAVANTLSQPVANGSWCTIALSVAASQPVGTEPLTLGAAVNVTTLNNGAINIVNVGPPTVNIAPPGNPVVLAGGAGTFGSATSATAVPVTLTSLSGAGTASYTCTGTGTSAPFSFAPASGGPFSNGAPDPTDISVSCTRGAAVVTGNVSCARTGGATTPVTFAVECPAGTQTMPTLGASPVGGSTLNGAAAPLGGQSCATVTITPTGGVGVTPANLTCTAGAGLTVTPAGAMSFLPGSTPQTVQVCATTTNAPQSFPIGSGLDCGGADGTGNVQFRYVVEIPAGSLAPPPTNVPASSLWSKLALFGLFGALGMLILGLRRSH